MMTFLGLLAGLVVIGAVLAIGRHPTQEQPAAPPEPAVPSVSKARQAARAAELPQTSVEQASLAETRSQLAEQRSHDAKMAAAAGVAGVVAGAALMHHRDVSATQVHIDAANAAQQNTFVQNLSYGDDFADDVYDDGYNDGYRDEIGRAHV